MSFITDSQERKLEKLLREGYEDNEEQVDMMKRLKVPTSVISYYEGKRDAYHEIQKDWEERNNANQTRYC